MTAILGLSGFYHDSAAALVVDGQVIAAAQEERFSRRKHDAGFPRQAVAYCLKEGGIEPSELDWVGFYEKPLLKFDRLLETYLAYAPVGFRSFRQAIPGWLRTKLFLPRVMARELPGYAHRFVFAEHHESHAASAFFPSPFEEAAILTMDGVGEWSTASLGLGRGNRIDLTQSLRFPHSLGLLYSALTYYTGFRVNSGEYKVMGLAPYGKPIHATVMREKLLDLKEDGSFHLDMSYFRYAQGLTMTSPKFHKLFGGPPRSPEAPITQREMDLAASIQAVTEEVVLRMARHVHKLTKARRLCLAGGVALNCVANGRVSREGPFDELWIQPASGDAGGALGIALFIEHQLLGRPRVPIDRDSQRGSLLGPGYSNAAIERFLQSRKAEYQRFDTDEALCESVAECLAEGLVVGWFQGRMEFGPRALGARSLLADPRRPEMQAVLNLKVKFRESFRPFAPAVLLDRASELYEIDEGQESPYMLLTFAARPGKELPAVTHLDRSARVQTVDPARSPLFHLLLTAFERRTGCPALINTSFNVRGEPIVRTPADAYRGYQKTHIDVLAIGPYLLRKAGRRPITEAEVNAHLAQFPPD